ncbi:MAG: hypothetical protein UIH27_19565 [Ruminococcus sp.]|nr:hypothetical protein [Ruminococcus sp.]
MKKQGNKVREELLEAIPALELKPTNKKSSPKRELDEKFLQADCRKKNHRFQTRQISRHKKAAFAGSTVAPTRQV